MTIKLTDAQVVMMSEAAQREERCLVPPKNLKGGAIAKVSAKLIGAGLVREIKAKADMPIWRRDEEGRTFTLKLTAAGLKAIAPEDDAVSDQQEKSAPQLARSTEAVEASSASGATAPRASSKLALVIGLLQREGGATIGDLTEATGWLPHTTRAAITGLRKRGYSVVRDKNDGGASAYRVQGVVAPANESGVKARAAVFSADEAAPSPSLRGRSKAKQAA